MKLATDLLAAKTSDTPDWLKRPGKLECGDRWSLVAQIYSNLQGADLPEIAPLRESRQVDAVLRTPASGTFLLEFDETQHFNRFRRSTLVLYPSSAEVRFDMHSWLRECDAKRSLEGGGWA